MDKIPMTAAGYATLEAELKHCQQVERPRIIQQITDARTHGDLSENAEYHAAKEAQSLNEGRIAELEDKLARADVIDVSKLSGETITFGADGLPTAWTISGTTTFGSKVNETFQRDKSRATWLDSTGKGQASPKAPSIYVAQSGSPWSLQIYARALLKQPGMAMPARIPITGNPDVSCAWRGHHLDTRGRRCDIEIHRGNAGRRQRGGANRGSLATES
jgi:hypothetical protein